MTDTVAATAGATTGLTDRYTRPVDEAQQPGDLDKDTFLKLLVAQMRFQDPLNPTSSDDFIATTAQFTTVEKLDELTKQGANTALVNSLTTAGTLIGHTITALVDGVEVTATVSRSRISAGQVLLETDKGDVRLGQIVAIGPASAPPTSAPPTSPPPAASPPTADPTDESTPADRTDIPAPSQEATP
jgi:flagellar basal-body rod modification protein FlgD